MKRLFESTYATSERFRKRSFQERYFLELMNASSRNVVLWNIELICKAPWNEITRPESLAHRFCAISAKVAFSTCYVMMRYNILSDFKFTCRGFCDRACYLVTQHCRSCVASSKLVKVSATYARRLHLYHDRPFIQRRPLNCAQHDTSFVSNKGRPDYWIRQFSIYLSITEK